MSIIKQSRSGYKENNCSIWDIQAMLVRQNDTMNLGNTILNCEIPYKGFVQTQLSNMWMRMTENIIPNYLISDEPELLIPLGATVDDFGSTILAQNYFPLPFTITVHGYYVPSSPDWNYYKSHGELGGNKLPKGLKESQKLPNPIFVPVVTSDYKRFTSSSDMDYEEMVNCMKEYFLDTFGGFFYYKNAMAFCEKIREVSIQLYKFAYEYAKKNGIIIANTKFKFGLTCNTNELIIVGELLTPDSSTFWDEGNYVEGIYQPPINEVVLNEYLAEFPYYWNRTKPNRPGPKSVDIPDWVRISTSGSYCKIFDSLHLSSSKDLPTSLKLKWSEVAKKYKK